MAQRRLLYVLNEVDYFLAHWLERAVAARDHGFDVHVAAPSAERVGEILEAGLAYHAIPLVRENLHPIAEVSTIRALRRLYRRLQPDIVHHATIKPVIYGGIAARWAGMPAVINTVPGLGSLFASNNARTRMLRTVAKNGYRVAFASRGARVIFENSDDCRDFTDWGLIKPEQGVVIKGAGVDTERFHAAPEPPGPVRVVMAARLLWDKGVGDFVDAAWISRERGVAATWVLAGDTDAGSKSAVPTSQLRAWHDSGVIEWIGRQSDMPAVLRGAHIVCHPSTYREGVPRILIEAASCGRPCVTTDAPGCREIVRHGVNGLLVPQRDAAAVSAAVEELVRDSALRREMGARGREVVETEFAREIVIEALLAQYDELVRR